MDSVDTQKILLNDLYNLLRIGKYDLVLQKITSIKDNPEYNNYQLEIEFLLNYLNKRKQEKEIEGTKEEKEISRYKQHGKLSEYYGDIDNAINYYNAGYYLYGDNEFLFLAGKSLLYTQDEKAAGVEYLKQYIDEGGVYNIIKAYDLLKNYYKFIDYNQTKKYSKKEKRLLEITNNGNDLGKNIVYSEEENKIIDYIREGRLDFVLEMYSIAGESKKVEIISELYKSGYKRIADKLLKKYKYEGNKTKNSKRLVMQLEKNKKLFIAKGKNISSTN